MTPQWLHTGLSFPLFLLPLAPELFPQVFPKPIVLANDLVAKVVDSM